MKKILLTRLWTVFVQLVNKYMSDHNMTQQELADLVGMQRSHLNAMLNKAPSRPLSAYYLLKFIRKGVITVAQIKDGQIESDREQEFWDQAKEAENLKLLSKIARIRQQGIDFEKFLEIHFPDI